MPLSLLLLLASNEHMEVKVKVKEKRLVDTGSGRTMPSKLMAHYC